MQRNIPSPAMVSPPRVGALLVLAACCTPAWSFALAPLRAPLASAHLRSVAAPLARNGIQPLMQVEAPVKIPDTFNPDLAPAKPTSDKASEKGKKYKLLLFNDNVNRCAIRRVRPLLWQEQFPKFLQQCFCWRSSASAQRGAPKNRLHARSFLSRPLMHAVAPRSREYVARVLVQTIPELQQADAYVVMQKAHKQGMAVVGVWVFEIAEAYCDSLKSGGLICSVTEESD